LDDDPDAWVLDGQVGQYFRQGGDERDGSGSRRFRGGLAGAARLGSQRGYGVCGQERRASISRVRP
jgi:hypothetical protein